MRRPLVAVLLVAVSVPAIAHISVASGIGFANTTQEITLGVGHGCEGADTAAVRTVIPTGVTSVRALTSDFGRATVEMDAAGAATAVNWVKPDADVLPVDTNYYKLTVRLKLPNSPFTTLYFPTTQTCKASDGGTLVSHWTNVSGIPPDAGEPEPAPAVVIMPARKPGWNKFTVPVAVTNLMLYFPDAQIVWKDNAAFSPNANVTTLIGATSGVTALTSLAANDEIWVKY